MDRWTQMDRQIIFKISNSYQLSTDSLKLIIIILGGRGLLAAVGEEGWTKKLPCLIYTRSTWYIKLCMLNFQYLETSWQDGTSN